MSKITDIIKSFNFTVEDVAAIPNIENKETEKLFAVCIAELTSIPFVFHAINPKIQPEIKISIRPILLYP